MFITLPAHVTNNFRTAMSCNIHSTYMEEQRGCAQVVNISSIFEIMRDKKLSLGTKKLLLNSKNIAAKLLKYQ